MEKTVSYSLAVKGIGGGAVIYPHKIGVLETAKSRSLDLSTISGLLKKINFSVFTNLPSLPAGRLNCNLFTLQFSIPDERTAFTPAKK